MKSTNETDSVSSDSKEQKPNSGNEFAKMAPRWAAIIGLLAIGVLYAFLPEELSIGPNWLLLAIEVIALLPLVFSLLAQRRFSHLVLRIYALVLLGIVTLALISGVTFYIFVLPTDKHATNLLRSAALLWLSNVLIFALWYWEIDGGGPAKRHQSGHQAADFMFPQQANENDGSWVPHFLDYVFLAFTGATAFSPTDTFPLTRLSKTLMMIEALLSLTIIGLLAARAVNILGS